MQNPLSMRHLRAALRDITVLCGLSLAGGLIALAAPQIAFAQIYVPDGDSQTATGIVVINGGTIDSGGTYTNNATLENSGGSTLTNNGTLINNTQFTNNGTLTNNGTFTNNGTLINNNDFNVDSALNSTGTLTNNNFMTIRATLTNTGTFNNPGITSVNGGQLIGNIFNTGTFTITTTSSNTYSGVMSGNGQFNKNGNHTQILTGDSSGFTGSNYVGQGILQIGNGGTTGALGGNFDVTSLGTLAFNRSDDLTYANVISGAGSVTKLGAGTLTLSGTNTYTGTTTVSGGTLLVNGAASSSAFTIQNGTTLGGTGPVGATTLQSGGIHAPGNSIGTQTVNGNYTLNSGSILAIEVNAAGDADQVIVNGAVDLGGATLRILGLPDNDMSGQDNYTHIIIANDGVDAVVGTFNSINNQLAFYDASVAYSGGTGNDVTLSLTRNDTDFTDHAVTGNQSAVAAVIDDLPGADGATIRAALQGLTTAEVQRAYEQLSGDVHASTTAINGQIARQAGGQIGGRLAALNSNSSTAGTLVAAGTLSPAALAGFASAGPAASDHIATDADTPLLALGNDGISQTGSAIWLQAIGGKGRVDGDENIDTTDYKWAGMIGGYDTRLSETTTIGIYFGYADGNSRQSGRDATLDSANLMAGIYGTHDLGDDWRMSGQAGWTRIGIDSSRNLDFGSIDRTATADYTDNALNADIELAKGFAIAPNWRAEPYGGLGVTWNRYGSFSETGADSANISRAADDDLSGTASLGVRFSGMIDTGDGKTLIPQFRLGWDHHIGPVSNSTTLAFAGTPSFTVSGSETDRDRLVGNLGFALADDDGWTLYADYQPSISENSHEHAFGAGFRMKF
ncbi:autotransporter outer membrane beta-barrel domain-containing protein [Thalassospira sp. A3_1]|uniref:autotransporter family protein n=1 Tax=Thalassospira sp. A3_1 TaxID=2821088 RepID=UPI001AD95DE0|nr:autotransporter outer membrane beta-barrel domain-containing protein [Thalassospira sp. A3_1]MBO9508019.1 autotransporter domain-containing protein [Thalassospira sp. A3_1]